MAETLRQLVERGTTVTAPGVGDALGALLVREAGFPALSISGYYVAATMGYPDVGLVTLDELAERTALICEAASMPVIVDGDNGYGNFVNVMRTVKDLERAGAAAIVLEDQVLPKKCGGTAGIRLVTPTEMVGKLRAALDTRRSSDTLIVARTDALHVSGGIPEAIERANLYREAGADASFAHGLATEAGLKRFQSAVRGPLMAGIGTSADFSVAQLGRLGYQLIIYSLTLLRCSMVTMRSALADLRANGIIDHKAPSMLPVADLHRFFGMDRLSGLEDRYGANQPPIES